MPGPVSVCAGDQAGMLSRITHGCGPRARTTPRTLPQRVRALPYVTCTVLQAASEVALLGGQRSAS